MTNILDDEPSETLLPEEKIEMIKKIRIGKEPTLDEKINFIYTLLKKQQRNARLRLIAFLMLSFAFFYFFIIYLPTVPQETKQQIQSQITRVIGENLKKVIQPIVQDMASDMVKDMTVQTGAQIDSQDILQEIMKNKDMFPGETPTNLKLSK